MATARSANGFMDECQTLFEKGQESWKSYFTRWEVFAKYEEDLHESELFTEAKEKAKSSKPKKVKRQAKSHKTKSTVLPPFKYKKNQRNLKKIIKRKRVLSKSKQNINVIEPNHDPNNDSLVEDTDNVQLETILKTALTKVLSENKSEFQIFAVLSQTYSGREVRNPNLFHQPALVCCSFSKSFKPFLEHDTNVQTISPYRGTYMGNLNKHSNLLKFSSNFRELEQIRNSVFNDSFPKFKINYPNNLNEQQFFLPVNGNQTARQTKSAPKISYPALLNSPSSENTKLMSFKWDLSLKSENSICGKINREHFIKGSFHKMSMMAQDGKRFRDLCLRKRTNTVTLSMENSNFITPERNPLERKCFSENILQRKRRRPSKLFFGDEEEDSESDDPTEIHTPIIHCKSKKTKFQTISEVVESDSDDCESIFDRVSRS